MWLLNDGSFATHPSAAQREYEHRLAGLRETLQARKANMRRAEEELKRLEELQKAAQDEYDDAVDERQEGI
jgi:hypothetical protein